MKLRISSGVHHFARYILERFVISSLLETLNNSDGDSYENVTLKVKVSLLHTLSRLFHLVQFTKCWEFSLELNSKRLYRSSGKGKESRCLVFTYSIKREIWHFYVVVLQWLQRNVQKKRDARAELLFCQSWNLLLFCRSRWRRRRRCLSYLILYLGHPSQFLREKPWGRVWKTHSSRQ